MYLWICVVVFGYLDLSQLNWKVKSKAHPRMVPQNIVTRMYPWKLTSIQQSHFNSIYQLISNNLNTWKCWKSYWQALDSITTTTKRKSKYMIVHLLRRQAETIFFPLEKINLRIISLLYILLLITWSMLMSERHFRKTTANIRERASTPIKSNIVWNITM